MAARIESIVAVEVVLVMGGMIGGDGGERGCSRTCIVMRRRGERSSAVPDEDLNSRFGVSRGWTVGALCHVQLCTIRWNRCEWTR